MHSSLVRVRGLDKKYQRGSEEIHVLQGLNLDVDEGDFVAFMGPSGSGKTTLLNLLGGLDLPTAGTITVAGDEITHLSGSRLTQWRARHVGFIFQMYNLIPVLTAFQNVELPLLLTRLSKAERRSHVEVALEVVGLKDRMHHYPRQLSGGQEQRVGIARAIVADPTFLLCDEPTGDLDRKSANEIMDLICQPVGRAPQDRVAGDPRSRRSRARASPCCISTKGCWSRGAQEKREAWPERLHEILRPYPHDLVRKKIRTALTIGSFAVALFLFGLLAVVQGAFNQGVRSSGRKPPGGDQ